jgi:hypothetical protein
MFHVERHYKPKKHIIKMNNNDQQTNSQILELIAQMFEENGDHGNALLLRDRAKIESITEEASVILQSS